MEADCDLLEPLTEDEAVTAAVRLILKAANHLCVAADLAEEGTPVHQYVNAAIHMRDLVNSLSPERPSWPTDGCEIFDIATKQKVN